MICSWVKPHSWINSLQDLKNRTRKDQIIFLLIPMPRFEPKGSYTGRRISMHQKTGKMVWRPKRRQLVNMKHFFFSLVRRKLVKLSLLRSPTFWSFPCIIFPRLNLKQKQVCQQLCHAARCYAQFFSNFTIRHNAV